MSIRPSFAPLTGVASVACFVVGFVILGVGKAPGPFSADEIVSFYTENSSKVTFGSTLFMVGAVAFLFFVGSLWRVLRSAEGPTGWLSNVALGGGIVATAGMFMFTQLGATLAEVADHIDPAAAQAIHSVHYPAITLPGGMAILLLAGGLVVTRTKALPVWLGWVALVLGVASLSRLGFAVFLASWLWIVIVSILLVRRMSASAGPGA